MKSGLNASISAQIAVKAISYLIHARRPNLAAINAVIGPMMNRQFSHRSFWSVRFLVNSFMNLSMIELKMCVDFLVFFFENNNNINKEMSLIFLFYLCIE